MVKVGCLICPQIISNLGERAVRNRIYTGKTQMVRGFQILDFSLVRAGGLCLCSRDF